MVADWRASRNPWSTEILGPAAERRTACDRYFLGPAGAGGYHKYPTSSNVLPSNDLINPDRGNSANFFLDGGFTLGEPYWRTEVGEFENSSSPNGAFDQGGNVWEWNETVLDSARGMCGGSFGSAGYHFQAQTRFGEHPTGGNLAGLTGFHVAEVPEPATVGPDGLGRSSHRSPRRIGTWRGIICLPRGCPTPHAARDGDR